MYNLESFQNSSDFVPLVPPNREDISSTRHWHVSHGWRSTETRQHNGRGTAPCARLSVLCLHLNADLSSWHLPRMHSHAALSWRPNPSYSPGQPGISCAGPSYVHLCSGLAAAGAPSTCLCGSTDSRSTHSHSLPAQSRRSYNMPSRPAMQVGAGRPGKHHQPGSRHPTTCRLQDLILIPALPLTPLPWLWPAL